MKRTFEVTTDIGWEEFRDRVLAWFEAVDVRLNYRINADTCAWLDLTCKSDLDIAKVCVGKKALVARTWVVSMEVKNVVSNDLFSTKEVLTLVAAPKTEGTRWEKRETDP